MRAATGLACVLALPARAPAADAPAGPWIATWGNALDGPASGAGVQAFSNQTLRLVVQTSAGGNRVRIRISNAYGSTPLTIGAARIAVRAAGPDIAPGSDRALSFGGRGTVTIAPGSTLVSDPVEASVPALSELAISLYLPGTVQATTLNANALQTSYVSTPGDFSAARVLPVQREVPARPFLAGVEVEGMGASIVALGDAIVAGTGSTFEANRRWPDWLARRLHDERASAPGLASRLGVVNLGAAGKRVVNEASHPAADLLARFERDVLTTGGVRYLLLSSGLDDIAASPAGQPMSDERLIAGYRRLAARAHAHGIAVFGATLTPFGDAASWSPAKEGVRQTVNDWIRASGEFDGVVDFDQAVRDPARPTRLLPAYDSGDHRHPGDLGHQALAEAVPLPLFQAQPPAR